eukprot:COSAG06_NODE_50463_length_318_cov_1.114155_1_plen_74_part_01
MAGSETALDSAMLVPLADSDGTVTVHRFPHQRTLACSILPRAPRCQHTPDVAWITNWSVEADALAGPMLEHVRC